MASLRPSELNGRKLPKNIRGGSRGTSRRNRRRRYRRPASGALSAETWRRRHAHYRPFAGGLPQQPPAEHGGTPSCDGGARGLSQRQSLERAARSLLLPRPFLQLPAADQFSWRLFEAKPRRRLPALSAGVDEGLRRSRRQNRIPPDRGGRYRATGRPVRSARRFDRQGPARPALHLPAGTHALFTAAAAALRRPLHWRPAARADERDAVGVPGTWRDDRHPHHYLRRRRQRASDGERPRRRHGGTRHAQL